MECEVCGRQIFGRPYNVIIEGAKLLVCSECAKSSLSTRKYVPEKPRASIRRVRPPTRQTKTSQRTQTGMLEDSVIIEGYGKRIRLGREQLGLTHEELSRQIGEKISLLQKLETEKMTPDLALARKLEKTLKIKILGSFTTIQVDEELREHKPTDLTLGDIVVVQKREEH
jgi:putative transcription factor